MTDKGLFFIPDPDASLAFAKPAARGLLDFAWPGHDYAFTQTLGGSTNDIGRGNSEVCVVPGTTSSAPIRSGGEYTARGLGIPGEVITTQTGAHSFRNTTIPGKHLFGGTVDRQFTEAPNGQIQVTTIGKGRADIPFFDYLNQAFGPAIFRGQNERCAEEMFGRPGAPWDPRDEVMPVL